LDKIFIEATEITTELLVDFKEIPVGFVYGKVSIFKWLSQVQLPFYNFFLKHTFSAKKAKTQSLNAKKFFANKLQLLEHQWSFENDREPKKIRKSTEFDECIIE
jgi:hypothetical protein